MSATACSSCEYILGAGILRWVLACCTIEKKTRQASLRQPFAIYDYSQLELQQAIRDIYDADVRDDVLSPLSSK